MPPRAVLLLSCRLTCRFELTGHLILGFDSPTMRGNLQSLVFP